MVDHPIFPGATLIVSNGQLGQLTQVAKHGFLNFAKPVLHIATSFQPLQDTQTINLHSQPLQDTQTSHIRTVNTVCKVSKSGHRIVIPVIHTMCKVVSLITVIMPVIYTVCKVVSLATEL